MSKIKVEHLNKSFGELKALKDINLEINDGDIVCLIGLSGSDQSTHGRGIHMLEAMDRETI